MTKMCNGPEIVYALPVITIILLSHAQLLLSRTPETSQATFRLHGNVAQIAFSCPYVNCNPGHCHVWYQFRSVTDI